MVDAFDIGFLSGVLLCIIAGLILMAFPDEPQEDPNELTFCYWRRDMPPPPGWELADDLQGTNHGEYAVLLKKRER